MQIYAAPMEGLTGYIYRNAHRAFFPGVDRYFTPFLTPTQNHVFSARELAEVRPENNVDIPLTPQLLTANAQDFLWAAGALAEMGYAEVNLNLGCPAPMAVTRGKGAGMLADLSALARFLDAIFSQTPVRISIKTRIGLNHPEEFPTLLEVFRQYPLAELIVHPRVQADQYGNHPRMPAFGQAASTGSLPLVYNGDLFSAADCRAFEAHYPGTRAIMLGRGLIANPGLAAAVKGEPMLSGALLKAFHDRLFQDYRRAMPGERPLLFKMKALWQYMKALFPTWPSFEKRFKKVNRSDVYLQIVNDLFDSGGIDSAGVFRPED